MIVPALSAIGEKHGGPGEKFLEAAVVGYETIIRIGLAIDRQTFAHGWWRSTIRGAFGVVAAGTKFSDLSLEQTVNALGIALLHSGGIITGGNEGATARHLAFGDAAQNGVLALLAAEQGFTGPSARAKVCAGFV